jgi:alpha-glucosidase
MSGRKFLVCLLPLLAGAAHAQDERKIVSPDGQLEFRLFTYVPEGNGLNTIGYQLRWRGQPLIDTSGLGIFIHWQEPLLGENVGLSASKAADGPDYHGLIADYLQNSSTGRRIEVEVRVWNDSVAFRYVIPQQAPMFDLLVEDDMTEFHFAQGVPVPDKTVLPFVEPVPGGWVEISETRVSGLGPTTLVRSEDHILVTHLPDTANDPGVAYSGTTPWTGPWRILTVSAVREKLAESGAVRTLR